MFIVGNRIAEVAEPRRMRRRVERRRWVGADIHPPPRAPRALSCLSC
tara:strand:+ start:346 stop:486 length:141 start_codon:yes stop_codon:yes gene_type:complete